MAVQSFGKDSAMEWFCLNVPDLGQGNRQGACPDEITQAYAHEKLQLLMRMLLRMGGSVAGKAVGITKGLSS